VAYAGAGFFGIRPGAWLLLLNGNSVCWCSRRTSRRRGAVPPTSPTSPPMPRSARPSAAPCEGWRSTMTATPRGPAPRSHSRSTTSPPARGASSTAQGRAWRATGRSAGRIRRPPPTTYRRPARSGSGFRGRPPSSFRTRTDLVRFTIDY